MGLFDILKKAKSEKCDACHRTIKENAHILNNKKYCQECYNIKKAFTNNNVDQAPTKEEFEFFIKDVYFKQNRGVVLDGIILSGQIKANNEIFANGKSFLVRGLKTKNGVVDLAKASDENVALLLDEKLSADDFKAGDIVTANRSEEPSSKSNTFVCDVCGKELNIKYLHTKNTCSNCITSKEKTPPAPSTNNKKAEFCLGSFNFSDNDRQPIKALAIQYLPADYDSADGQLQILEYLSSVMSIDVVKIKTEFSWNALKSASDEMKKEKLTAALVETVLAVNQTLAFLNPDFLRNQVSGASSESLFKAWLTLDYYSSVLKPEYTLNIQHFRDYIHSNLLKISQDNGGLPIKIDGTSILFNSKYYETWKKARIINPSFEVNAAIALTEKEPSIYFYEDGIKTKEYVLQTKEDENFSGKYFLISVRFSIHGNPGAPVVQIDGFISDTPENRPISLSDIGYRMEVHFLLCGGEISKQRYEMNRGQDLPMKALKYQGYTTPSNIRLIGVCPDCGKSFCFHGYSFYMAQSDIAYSDDGLDCCEIQAYDIDKNTWTYEVDGKTFRYFNSFNCPHCGTPYIDYKKHPENKVFGVSGCVLLGKNHYQYK